jgi:hypothetical protein
MIEQQFRFASPSVEEPSHIHIVRPSRRRRRDAVATPAPRQAALLQAPIDGAQFALPPQTPEDLRAQLRS